jgi:hypothetical protein
VTYDPNALHVVSGPDAGDFTLRSSGTSLLVLASAENAQRALIVADGFGKLCTIGDGSRTMEWWRK